MLSKFKNSFGDQYPPKATVFRWFRQFMYGARTLEDDDHCDRMATTATQENVSRVESLIKKDPKMTYAEIQDVMKMSSGSLTRILHDCLAVRKCCARWVPHNLSEEQRWGSGVGWTGAPTCSENLTEEGLLTSTSRYGVNGVRSLLPHHDNTTTHTAAVTVLSSRQ